VGSAGSELNLGLPHCLKKKGICLSSHWFFINSIHVFFSGVANSTSGHTNKVDYITNNITALSDVSNSYLAALYTVTINSDQSRTLNRVSGATYAAGQLYVTVSKDENWVSGKPGTTEEYKDKEGHVVLKRTFNLVGTTVQVLSTYYIYDDLGNLAFVLPPNSNADAGITSAANQTTLDNVCYQYRYDERNRLTEKKLPGKGWEFMIYNTLDQVIFTQDANQRAQTPQIWTYMQYDAMGREVIRGLWNSTGASGSNGDTNQSVPNHTLKNWLIVWANAQTTLWLSPDNTTSTGYSAMDPNGTVLMINYYDDYTNLGSLPGYPPSFTVSGNSTMTKGLLTASKTAVLNNPSDYLWAVHYYDDKGRETLLFKQHYLGGIVSQYNYDQITNTYNDITSELTNSKREHYTKNANNTDKVKAVTVVKGYVYDHIGRRIQAKEQINGGANVLLSQTDYNEIGQLQTKHLHGATGAAPFMQDIAYTYNERGWLKTSNSPLFSMALTYNSGTNGNTVPFNGNISTQSWQIQGGASKSYNYTYDALNRLTAGISNEGYSEQGIDYDLVGNIQHLTRQSSAYAYAYTGNQLQAVSGLTTGTYQYDPNGNVKYDARTQKNIAYNLLNLPQSIRATGFNLSYTYDAKGKKLRKNNGATITDYIDRIQYENGNIIFIQTEEGRVIIRPYTFLPYRKIAKKPKIQEYSDNPETIGEHIRKKRIESGLLQKDVAALLAVSEDCVTYWENGRSTPQIHHYPRIIDFLGYYPPDHETDTFAGKLRHIRHYKGFSRKQCAAHLSVSEDAVRRWEEGTPIANPTYQRLIHSVWNELPHHQLQHPE
jgi:DNA-binding transcriptional regulator YiaG